MSERLRQLILDLPVEPRYAAEDFLVGPSNAAAFGFIDGWPAWPDRLVHLQGPAGSGKTHLTSIWAERSEALTLAAAAVSAEGVPGLVRTGALVLEDVDAGPLDEGALFHLVNLARERGAYVMVTSAASLDACAIRTPDLLSRLRLAPSLFLGAPDDDLLRAVLVKLFHDRQLAVELDVIAYLANRIERSLEQAAAIVGALDREALSRGRRVTRRMAAALLADGESLLVGED